MLSWAHRTPAFASPSPSSSRYRMHTCAHAHMRAWMACAYVRLSTSIVLRAQALFKASYMHPCIRLTRTRTHTHMHTHTHTHAYAHTCTYTCAGGLRRLPGGGGATYSIDHMHTCAGGLRRLPGGGGATYSIDRRPHELRGGRERSDHGARQHGRGHRARGAVITILGLGLELELGLGLGVGGRVRVRAIL